MALLTAISNDNASLDMDTLDEEISKIENISIEKGTDESLPWTVTGNGFKFQIKEDGTVEEINGIILSKTSIKMVEGQDPETITATLTDGVEGTINWSSNSNIVSISPETGNSTEITLVGTSGTAEITASVSETEYSATCTVTVTSIIGDYVEYNVTYKDVYTSYTFDKTTGWRILDPGTKVTHEDGSITYKDPKIISTGIPAKVYYHFTKDYNGNIISTEEDEDGNTNVPGWWGTSGQVKALYDTEKIKYSERGYVYTSDSSTTGYPNRFAAAGLLENFASIQFEAKTRGITYNKGVYSAIAINGTEETKTITGDIFILKGKATEVHNLTLAELNKARKLSETSGVSTATKDAATGLFYLGGLESYDYDSSTNCLYWLSFPVTDSSTTLRIVLSDGGFSNYGSSANGVRPVVSLNSEIYKDGDIWKIK